MNGLGVKLDKQVERVLSVGWRVKLGRKVVGSEAGLAGSGEKRVGVKLGKSCGGSSCEKRVGRSQKSLKRVGGVGKSTKRLRGSENALSPAHTF